jgi:hypothetical protein
MRQRLIDLLKALEAVIPPPRNCHHALTFASYGSDEAGWTDQLAVQINRGIIYMTTYDFDAETQRRGDSQSGQ